MGYMFILYLYVYIQKGMNKRKGNYFKRKENKKINKNKTNKKVIRNKVQKKRKKLNSF